MDPKSGPNGSPNGGPNGGPNGDSNIFLKALKHVFITNSLHMKHTTQTLACTS